jgi:hypothetical protein
MYFGTTIVYAIGILVTSFLSNYMSKLVIFLLQYELLHDLRTSPIMRYSRSNGRRTRTYSSNLTESF